MAVKLSVTEQAATGAVEAAVARLDGSESARLWVGCSGGLDSMVLLDAVARRADAEQLVVLHINHQLSPNADYWQATVAAQAAALGCRFEAVTVDCQPAGEGLEAAARAARYAVFEQRLGDGEQLLLGHHADDQLETLLYRLLRGAGLRGLAAMEPERPLGAGSLVRPLLGLPRHQLEAYAAARQLTWVEDESNTSAEFDRNFLRHAVVAPLRQRWPSWHQPLARTTDHLREGDQLLGDLAALDLAGCEPRDELSGQSLVLARWQTLPARRQRNLLRYWPWLTGVGEPLHGTALVELEGSVIGAREDAEPLLVGRGLRWRRFAGRLYLLAGEEPSAPADYTLQWSLAELPAELALPDGTRLRACAVAAGEGGAGLLTNSLSELTVSLRRGGERSRPAGRQHSAPLKKIYQQQAVAPWLRERLPLLWAGDRLAGVGDYWVESEWAAAPGESGIKIHWQSAAE